MKLNDYKLIFVAVGLIGVLLIASPALGAVLRLPAGEQFSELYLLGPDHMAENYPFNIIVGQNYSVYVGVGNHMGSSVYYVLDVKIRNQTDPMPNITDGTPSSLPPLYEYRFIVQGEKTWESPLTFLVSDGSFLGNQSLIKTLTINDALFNVNRPAMWDSNSTMFSYQLLFELWIYDEQSGTIAYNSRFVNLRLNFTSNDLPV